MRHNNQKICSVKYEPPNASDDAILSCGWNCSMWHVFGYFSDQIVCGKHVEHIADQSMQTCKKVSWKVKTKWNSSFWMSLLFFRLTLLPVFQTHCLSWYNHKGWLGIKHLLTPNSLWQQQGEMVYPYSLSMNRSLYRTPLVLYILDKIRWKWWPFAWPGVNIWSVEH